MCCWPPIEAAFLLSQDGGTSFTAANEGFSGRKVEALLVERDHPRRGLLRLRRHLRLWRAYLPGW